jgi:hypothetical protein
MARFSPTYHCETCFDPDEACQYDGCWHDIATFYCPDCDTSYEIPREQFDEEGNYIGGPMPEKDPRYELRGRHGNYIVFDTKHAIPLSLHSLKSVAEGRVNKLNEKDKSNG